MSSLSRTYQPHSDHPQSGERGESVNRDNRISLSDDSVKTDLIFFRGNVENSLGHAVSLNHSSFSKSSVDNNPRDAELSVLQHASMLIWVR